MKDWDPPLLNQPKQSNRLLSTIRRLRDLRESCGVKSESTATVNVRIPPRYLKP